MCTATQDTIVRGRCGTCRTPWTLNASTHRVSYQSQPPVTLDTNTDLGDDEWVCPTPVAVMFGPEIDPQVPDIEECGRTEVYAYTDQQWGF